MALAGLLAIGAATGIWFSRPTPGPRPTSVPPRELRQSELTLRDGRLYVAGGTEPFSGVLYENFPGGERKLEIEIHDGKAHGRSVGYYENRKPEVEEFFVHGVSHGLRTRWDAEGWKKSEAQIAHGKLNGRYREWHPDGTKAVEMTLRDGQPDGIAEAWHPDGRLKSRTRFADGKVVERQFFTGDASDPAGTADPEKPS